jgi:anaerobic glycerol-3-phosphate dehydrogenase
VLGGYDYGGGGCGFGVPLLTGWLAGRLAAA